MKIGSLFCVGLALWGCGDDDVATAEPLSPKLQLLGARSPKSGAEPVLAGCVAVGQDPDRTAFVVVDVENYELKPPAACRGQQACGSVVVDLTAADGSVTPVIGVVSNVPLRFSQLPLGEYEIAVRLVNDFGADAGSSACSPGPCESETILFANVCTDGGTPADGGSSTDAGESMLDSGRNLDAGDGGNADAASAEPAPQTGADAGIADAGTDASGEMSSLDSGGKTLQRGVAR